MKLFNRIFKNSHSKVLMIEYKEKMVPRQVKCNIRLINKLKIIIISYSSDFVLIVLMFIFYYNRKLRFLNNKLSYSLIW